MIAKIESKTQYGKMGTIGINLMSELDEQPVVSFAHSVQDALDWAKEFPLCRGAIIDDLASGSFVVSSGWRPYINQFEGLIEPEKEAMKKVEYTREQLLITPVNTIHENTGFWGYKHFSNS